MGFALMQDLLQSGMACKAHSRKVLLYDMSHIIIVHVYTTDMNSQTLGLNSPTIDTHLYCTSALSFQCQQSSSSMAGLHSPDWMDVRKGARRAH